MIEKVLYRLRYRLHRDLLLNYCQEQKFGYTKGYFIDVFNKYSDVIKEEVENNLCNIPRINIGTQRFILSVKYP